MKNRFTLESPRRYMARDSSCTACGYHLYKLPVA